MPQRQRADRVQSELRLVITIALSTDWTTQIIENSRLNRAVCRWPLKCLIVHLLGRGKKQH
jgi:hypothetical protein